MLHPEWVGERIETLTATLHRFRAQPGVLASCFTGAVAVQTLLVIYYLAVVYALHMPITVWDLAVIVPISLVVQMLPLSVNGFGLREATFSFYFTRLGLPVQTGVLLSLVATGLAMLFSLSGAAVYMSRGRCSLTSSLGTHDAEPRGPDADPSPSSARRLGTATVHRAAGVFVIALKFTRTARFRLSREFGSCSRGVNPPDDSAVIR